MTHTKEPPEFPGRFRLIKSGALVLKAHSDSASEGIT